MKELQIQENEIVFHLMKSDDLRALQWWKEKNEGDKPESKTPNAQYSSYKRVDSPYNYLIERYGMPSTLSYSPL